MNTPHEETEARIRALLEGEDDWVAAMSTVACELHHGFDHFHWTGFYRTVRPGHLKVGPYQGGHGCLDIPFERGICGAAARTKATQDVPDVHARPEHIACSSTTNSEVVVPVVAPSGEVVAVLDVDSDDQQRFQRLMCLCWNACAASLANGTAHEPPPSFPVTERRFCRR